MVNVDYTIGRINVNDAMGLMGVIEIVGALSLNNIMVEGNAIDIMIVVRVFDRADSVNVAH